MSADIDPKDLPMPTRKQMKELEKELSRTHPVEQPLRSALLALLAAAQRLEQAEEFHANCPDCDGEEVPELCETCFPHFDDARVMRRKAISEAIGVVAVPASSHQG